MTDTTPVTPTGTPTVKPTGTPTVTQTVTPAGTPADTTGARRVAPLPTTMRSLGGKIFHWLLRRVLALRYTLDVQGLDAILQRQDNRPLLILPSHSALIDPIIMYSLLLPLTPRALADQRQVDKPVIRDLLKPLNLIIIPDVGRDGRGAGKAIREGLRRAVQALRQGDHVLLYPSGRITRDGKDHVAGNSGAYRLYAALCPTGQQPGCRVVLVRARGLWGSSFSMGCARTGGEASPTPFFIPLLRRGVRDLLCNGLFFMPRRPVRVIFEEATQLPPAEAGPLAFNRALEAFYHAEPQPRVLLPRYFWHGRTVTEMHEARDASYTPTVVELEARREAARQLCESQPELTATVLDILREECGVQELTLAQRLSADLGLDSLRLTEISLRLQEIGGHAVQRMDLLTTVGDCVLAGAGTLEHFAPHIPLPQPPKNWHGASSASAPASAAIPPIPPTPLSMPQGCTVVEVFLRQMRAAPSRPLLATPTAQPFTVFTRRAVLVRALALASWLRTDPRTKDQPRVGIMLPASSAATVLWLATLLAGKVPVMVNWTAGEANVRHGLRLAATHCVLTARQLVQRLEHQGFTTGTINVHWIALEDVATCLGLKHKLRAVMGTVLALAGLLSARYRTLPPVPDTAAILFTSGSETVPKAVPLSHANVLANCRDVVKVLQLRESDTLLGMLPPFHSLGLTGNVVVALGMGMPVVFHPNPTEAALLNDICRVWRVSVMLSPPTFLEGMLVRAAMDIHHSQSRNSRDSREHGGNGPLASLRVGFVGAEKCPDAVYAAFAAQTGGVLCEGYGITECSPGVCINLPSDPRPGTIGLPLPSVETALVLPLEGTPQRRAEPDEAGMMLVRGPNVFNGYLTPPAHYAETPTPAQPFVEFEGKNWYRSGDLVSADAGGHMTFRGRLGRFVKLGGEMISLPQMESVLLTAFETRRGAVEGPLLAVECPVPTTTSADNTGSTNTASAPHGKVVITLFSAVHISREEANAALRAAGLPSLCAVHTVRPLDAIPVLGSGKTDYRALKRCA